MMKRLSISLLISVCVMGFAALPAFAQTRGAPSNPDTQQTDQSEEDWRKSKKKRNTSDIFEDILNTRNDGSGSGYGPADPMDSLPEESRRHLMKERAKVLARMDIGKAPTTAQAPYTPSDAAQDDRALASQEKTAWESVIKDMQDDAKGGNGHDPQGQPGGQGQQSQSQTGQDQAGQNSSNQDPSSDRRSAGTMRGGSSASVADIMAQIKGLKSGTASERSSQSQTQNQSQNQGQSQDTGSAQTDTGSGQGQSGDSGQNQDSGTAQDTDQASAAASATAQNAAADAANAANGSSSDTDAAAEPMGPLDRLKKERSEADSGRKTSASDYLKTKPN